MARTAIAYASDVDVLRHLPFYNGTFRGSGMVNATQAHGHILAAADELDAALAAEGYGVPIATSATTAFSVLGQWNSIGAAMYIAQSQPQGANGKHLPFLERRWNAILQRIDEGDVVLPGVSKDSTVSGPRVGRSTCGASPYFTRDMTRVL